MPRALGLTFLLIGILSPSTLALGALGKCPSPLSGTQTGGGDLDQFEVTGKDDDMVGQCCDACMAAPGCDAWELEVNDDRTDNKCYLKYLWKDDGDTRSNFRGNCLGRVATGLDHSHEEVAHIPASGSTSEEMDKDCCDECTKHPACEGWEVHQDKDCYLYQFTASSGDGKHWAGLAPRDKSPIPVKGTCNVIPEAQGRGQSIRDYNLRSVSQEDQDAECCNYCALDDDCEFWVRKGTEQKCTTMKDWTSNAIWQQEWRTGFKQTNLADVFYCKAIQGVWHLAGLLLKNIEFSIPKVGLSKFQVNLPTSLKCGKLSFQNKKVVGALDDFTIAAHVEMDNLKGMTGSANVFVQADPDVVLDFNQCKVDVLRTNMWQLGLGFSHEPDLSRFTQDIFDKYHFGFKHNGCDNVLPAYPTWQELNGDTLMQSELPGLALTRNNAECCKLCQEYQDGGRECDAFETHQDGDNTKCNLMSLWDHDDNKLGNWRGNTTAKPFVHGQGNEIGKYNVFGDTQEERNAACSQQCDEADACDLWEKTTNDRQCSLQMAKKGASWINNGFVRGIANLIIDYVLVHMLNSVMKTSCGSYEKIKLLNKLEDWTKWGVRGSGTVSWKGQENFWDSEAAKSLLTTNWTNLEIELESAALSGIKASNFALSWLVNDMIDDFKAGFGAKIGEHFATPVAWLVGTLVSTCVDNGDSCPSDWPPSKTATRIFV